MLSLPILSSGDEQEIPVYRGCVENDLRVVSRNLLAERITGGLSQTRKMPCPSWGIAASRCKTGSRLARIAGTVCHACYALSGNYQRDAVVQKQEERFQGLFHPLWVPSMVFLIRWKCADVFRWFDAGDVQSVSHLHNINTVALHTPDIRHWLPSREKDIIRQTRRLLGELAPNLLIRASATKVDGPAPKWWQTSSTVVTSPEEATCPAPRQEGACGECRLCWDGSVEEVSYLLH